MIKIADFVTIGNFAAGLLSIIFTIKSQIETAAGLIILAVVFDFLDGRIARATHSANAFGRELDSLADVTSFGIAPAILGYGAGLTSTAAIIILVYFAACGMLRLARFNISKSKGFSGVPITVNGLLFPILLLVLKNFSAWVVFVYLIMGLLMISTIKFKKI